MPNEVDVVQELSAAICRREPLEIAELMTEDHTFVDSSGKISSGRHGMIMGRTEYCRMFPDNETRLESILADNRRVAIFGTAAGACNASADSSQRIESR